MAEIMTLNNWLTRTDGWLEQRGEEIWQNYFSDIQQENKVQFKFKGRWRTKLGHIRKLKNKHTEIAINSLLQDPIIPEWLIDVTIAHEICHYVHGFCSPLPQKYKHPHQSGVIEKELARRNFDISLVKKQNKWTKAHWGPYCSKVLGTRTPRPRKRKRRRFF